MRRFRWIIGICLTFGLMTAAGQVAFAGTSGGGVPPGGNRILEGKTSQGQKIQVVMHRINGGWGLQELDFGAVLRCQDGRRIGLNEGIYWFGPLESGQNDRFDIDDVSLDEGFHFHGRIGPRGGSGTIEETFPTLTQDEKAQTCTSKERTWTLQRTSPALVSNCCVPHAPGVSWVLTVTARIDHGTAHISRSWIGPRGPSTTLGKTRSYGGRTSQGRNAHVETRQFDAGWRLEKSQFGFRVRCQDGTSFSAGVGYLFGGRSGPLLGDGGSFGIDDADFLGAFHLHGRVGPHDGSGTVETLEPGLTQDEQAMICTSKERDWDVKRQATPVPVAPVSSTIELRTTSR